MDRVARVIGVWGFGGLVLGVVLIVANLPDAGQPMTPRDATLVNIGIAITMTAVACLLLEVALGLVSLRRRWQARTAPAASGGSGHAFSHMGTSGEQTYFACACGRNFPTTAGLADHLAQGREDSVVAASSSAPSTQVELKAAAGVATGVGRAHDATVVVDELKPDSEEIARRALMLFNEGEEVSRAIPWSNPYDPDEMRRGIAGYEAWVERCQAFVSANRISFLFKLREAATIRRDLSHVRIIKTQNEDGTWGPWQDFEVGPEHDQAIERVRGVLREIIEAGT